MRDIELRTEMLMGTYRDEREAAHAQNEALQVDKAKLEQTVDGLSRENDSLRRENDALRGQLGIPAQRSNGRRLLFIALGVIVALFVMGVAAAMVVLRAPEPPPAPAAPQQVLPTPPAPPTPMPAPPT